MDLKILIISVLLKFTSSMPDPKVNVNVDVNVEDRDGCNGCTLGCVFGDKSYSNKCDNEESCLVMKCNKGTWEYTGEIRKDCENCTATGDPHFYMFDNHCVDGSCGRNYTFQEVGDHVIAQDGNSKDSSLFGVNSNFQLCNNGTGTGQGPKMTCVQNITYYEPGITVTLTVVDFNDIPTIDYCSNSSPDPTTDPRCAIKVFVNGAERTIGKTVHSFSATDGTVLVFNHDHIQSPGNENCVNIVGSTGLSVSLCQHMLDFSWVYVFSMPSCKSDPSKLYGLCDTYTGTTRNNYIMSGGSGTTNLETFGNSWVV